MPPTPHDDVRLPRLLSRTRRRAAALAVGLVLAGSVALGTQPAVAAGTTAYVAERGSDAGNDCARESLPCATVSHALTQVGPGATIRVSGTILDNVDVPWGLTPLTISGAGAPAPAVIDGSSAGSVISHGGQLRVEHLTIRGGEASQGGGIRSFGVLVLSHSTVTGNVARDLGGGVYIHSNGSARVLDSTITDNRATHAFGRGGGIYSSEAPLTILRSTISENQAGSRGGGVDFASFNKTFLMADSTVAGNSAPRGGGLAGGNMLIRTSTVADNRATFGGGIANFSTWENPLRLLSSTVTGNTDASTAGGVYNDGSRAEIGATIIAGNSSPQCDGSSSGNSLGHNLSSDGSCIGHATDLSGVDPGLGALAHQGGGTPTMMPASAGPASNAIPVGTTLAGIAVCGRDDQRGVAGPVVGATGCAIGAVEPAAWALDSQLPLTVTSRGDVVAGVTLGTAGGSGGGEVSFEVTPGTATGCRVEGLAEPFVLLADSFGTCRVRATRGAAGRYAAASSEVTTVEVPRAPQYTVYMNGGISGRLDTALPLAASGGAGTGAYTFATVPGGTAPGCSVSTGAPWTITATGAGTCLVVATREADARYEARTSDPQPVEFRLLTQQALVVSSPLQATIGQPLVLSTTGGSGAGEVTWWPSRGSVDCSVTGSGPFRLTATAAGWCSVYAIKRGDDRYASRVSPAVSISWDKGEQTPLVLTSTTGRFGVPLALEFTGGGGTGDVTVATEDGTATGCAARQSWPSPFMLTSSSPGTCLVTVTKAGDNGYHPASSVRTTLTLTKEPQAALRVTGSLTGVVGSPLPLASEGGSGTGTVSHTATNGTADDCTISGSALTSSTAGTCLVTATKAGDATYEPVSSAPTTVTFGKLAQAPLAVTSVRGTQGTPLLLTSSGGSGAGALHWTAADGTAARCQVTASAPHLLTAESPGTCLVTVTRAADTNHLSATSSVSTVTLVAPAPGPTPPPGSTPETPAPPAPGGTPPIGGTPPPSETPPSPHDPTLPAVPGKVSKVKVAGSPSAAKRKVTWAAPATTGALTFRVVVTKGKKKVLTKVVSKTSLTLKRGKLARGKLTITVTAANEAGAGRSVARAFRVG